MATGPNGEPTGWRGAAISVADRFSFSATEVMAMPLSELSFWYEAAVELYRQDKGE